MNIVGLGDDGCKIAAAFKEYPQYDIFYCKTGHGESDGLNLPEIKKIADAEQLELDFSLLRQISKEPVIFILNGSEETSVYALRILEQLKERRLTILYIKPNLNLLNDEKKKIERMTFGVLQEYTRSGLFEKIYLVDYKQMEKIIGEVPILEHFKITTKTIVDAIHLLNYLNNTEKIIDKLLEPHVINRICTLGLFNIETGEERNFFNIQNTREKQIFYLLTKQDLTTNKNLMTLINHHVEALKTESETVSFAVAESYHDNSYACTVSYTNFVQGMEKWLTGP